MTRIREFSLALLALLLLLSACSSGGGGTNNTPPTVPTGLSAVPGNGKITLTWNANSDSDLKGYNVSQGVSEDKLNPVAFVEVGTETYIADGLTNGQEYFFAINAEDSGGLASGKSPVISATPKADDGSGGDGGGSDEEVIVNEDVRVLGDEGRNKLENFSLDLQTGQGELRFEEGDPAVAALQPGQILVSGPVAGVAPHGFLQRIESKGREGDTIIFETSQATLVEVFNEAQIELTERLEPSEVIKAQTFFEGITLSYGTKGITPQGSTSFDFSIDFDQVLIDGDGNESTTDDQLRIDGAFNFDATASASIDIDCDCFPLPHPFVDRMLFKVRLEESADVGLTGELPINFDETIELARLDFGSFTISVGPVPVVFVIDLVISVGAKGQIEAHLEASAVQSSVAQLGLKYTDEDGFKELNEFDFDFDFPTPDITAAASVRGFLRPQLNIKIYGLAGPFLYAEAFVKADAELFRDPFWRLKAGLEAGLGFVIDLPVVGKIGEYEDELLGFEETLAESHNQAPELEVLEPTDGVRLLDGETLTFDLKATDREQKDLTVTLTDGSGQVLMTNGTFPDHSSVLFATDLCVGSYEFTVTARDNQGATDSETISATVDNFVPEVTVNDEIYNTEPVFADAVLFGFADVQDLTCGVEGNAADPTLIEWYLDGERVSSSATLFYPLESSGYVAGDELTLQARYSDGKDADSAEVTVTIQELPPELKGKPRAIMLKPDDEFINDANNIQLRGGGYDPEEGQLSGDALVWELEVDGAFVEIARGEEATFRWFDYYQSNREVFSGHELRLTVTDSDGNTDTVAIVLALPPSPE